MPAPRVPVRCPCGSRELYADCCGPLHRGRAEGSPTAPTAERLMRSRYSAFAVGDAPYLLATWHPSTRPGSLDVGDDEVQWRQLEIRDTQGGGESEDEGIVEFVAYFWEVAGAQLGQLHERSAFVRERGQWFYVGPLSRTGA